jgi:hypothetical protein
MLSGEVQLRQEQLAVLQRELTVLHQKIDSLDKTLDMVNSCVNPAAAGAVRATATRYGGYGGLMRFLLAQVKAAGKDGIDTRQLALCAASHFDAPVACEADLTKCFRNSVAHTLGVLRRRGEIDSASRGQGRGRPAIWRMRIHRSAFSDLLRQKQEFDKAANGG